MKSNNHKISTNLVLFVIPFLLFTGCSASLYKLKTIDKDKDFYMGREVVYKKDNFYSSNLSFEYQKRNNFVFYLEIQNDVDLPVTFYPENVYADQLNENKDLISNTVNNRLFALNPEKQIKYLESELKNNEDQHSLNTGLNATFALISVVAHLSDDDNHDKLGSMGDDVTNWSINQSNENADYHNAKNNIHSAMGFWKNEVFRKTTLYKNDKMGGLVFVPFNKDAKFIRLVVPIGKMEHVYLFKKIEIN